MSWWKLFNLLSHFLPCRSFWRKKTQGFHVTDFLGGMVATSCVLGFILWRKDYSVSRLMTRKQKGETIQVCMGSNTYFGSLPDWRIQSSMMGSCIL